jgi:hypothetical protein
MIFGTFGTFFIPYFKLSFILDSSFSFSPFYFFLKVSNKRIEMSQISQNIPTKIQCIDVDFSLEQWFLSGTVVSLWN